MLTASILDHPGIRHGFLTRNGGVSEGLYASLNCGPGSGDDLAHVIENRRRASASVAGRDLPLLTCYQIRSNICHTVTEPWAADQAPQGDALVTDRSGIMLGVLAADCAPVLLHDAGAGVIGAAHAGWQGALSGVVENTVTAMEELGAARKRIKAAVGPCIGQASYQVGAEFRDRFLAQDAESAAHFAPDGERFRFDLKGFVAMRLERLRIDAWQVLPDDTCADETRFFSYRRATQRGEPVYGRLVSGICLG